jgi:hypothetical protein
MNSGILLQIAFESAEGLFTYVALQNSRIHPALPRSVLLATDIADNG